MDPESAATDALRRPWALEGNCYAHPPIVLIPRVLSKLKEEQCELTLIAPVWATQAWMADLLAMSVAPPRLLLCHDLFVPVLPTRFTCRQPGWTTAVWRLSGDASSPKAIPSAVRDALWPSMKPRTTSSTSEPGVGSG